MLPNPVIYHVESPSYRVSSHRDWILGQMRALGGRAYLEQLEESDDAVPLANSAGAQRR